MPLNNSRREAASPLLLLRLLLQLKLLPIFEFSLVLCLRASIEGREI